MTASRNYSSTAQPTTLTGALTDTGTTMSVAAVTGFPAAPFVLCIDSGRSTEELVLVTTVSGLSLTVTRGYDSTTAVSHDAGSAVVHSHAAADFRDSRVHEAATAAHGVTGAVVGTTDVQTITHKDLSDASNVFPANLGGTTTGLTVSGTSSMTSVTATKYTSGLLHFVEISFTLTADTAPPSTLGVLSAAPSYPVGGIFAQRGGGSFQAYPATLGTDGSINLASHGASVTMPAGTYSVGFLYA